jgi:hypothetical protein
MSAFTASPARAALMLLMAVQTACASDPPRAAAVERDSAGIRIVENLAGLAATLPRWDPQPEPLVSIGSVDGDGPSSLFRVTGAVLMGDGRIAVANAGSSEVRFFDGAGRYLTSVGRPGDGPGEYRMITGLYLLQGDFLLVSDGRARRLTVLDATGRMTRTFRPGDASGVLAVAPDGTILGGSGRMAGDGDVGSGFVRRKGEVILLDAAGETTAALGEFPGPETSIQVDGSMVSVLIPPFARRSFYALQRENVVVSTQERDEYHVYDRRGTLLRIVRFGERSTPYSPAHLSAHLARVTGDMEPERAAQTRTRLEGFPAPDRLPPHGPIITDRDGNLWVSDFPDPGTQDADWTVYDADGRALARVALPHRFQPTDVGRDHILGVLRDDMDVEHVVLLAHSRTRGGH